MGAKDVYPDVEVSKDVNVHPDTAFKLLTDYENSPRIFKSVRSVRVEERGDQVLVTEQMGWRVSLMRGNYELKLNASSDPDIRRVDFQLAEPGFMQAFSARWDIKPCRNVKDGSIGSTVYLEQKVQPSIMPPGPFGPAMMGSIKEQITNVFKDLNTEGGPTR